MFLDESAFEVDEGLESEFSKPINSTNKPSTFNVNQGRHNNSAALNMSRPSTAQSNNTDDDDEGGLGSAGGLSTPSGSRARMLAQQRELQLKKRQASIQSGGMVRSSVDTSGSSSPVVKIAEKQCTPSVRQFSAPKAVRESDADPDSEFSRSRPTTASTLRDKDDYEEDHRRGGGGARATKGADLYEGRGNRDRDMDRGGSRAAPVVNKRDQARYNDDDDEDEPANRRRDPKGAGGGRGRGDGRRNDDYGSDEGEWDNNSRATKSRDGGGRGGTGAGAGNKGVAERRGGWDRDRDQEPDDRGKKGGNRGGRREDYDDDYDDRGGGGAVRRSRDDDRGVARGGGGGNRRDYDDDDDYERNRRKQQDARSGGGRRDDYDDGRGGGGGGRNAGGRGGRGGRNYDDEEEEEEAYQRGGGSRNNNNYDRDDRGGGGRRGGGNEDDRRRRGGGGGRGNGGGGRNNDHDDDRWDGVDNRGGAHDDDEEEDSRRGVRSRDAETPPVPRPITVTLDMSNMKRFLTTPIPKGAGVVQCYIRRNKSGTHKLFPIYTLYTKEGDRFLMTSKKRPNNKTSNYLISMSENDLNRDGENYLGKLRSNFVGTEFQVFDDGENPKDTEDDLPIAGGDHGTRKELGVVMYAPNVLGSRGPRKMQVAVPSVDENDSILVWKPERDGDMLTRLKDRNFRDLVYLINKPPRWNEQVGAYVLNFNGRVTMASVKNFQLVDPDEQAAVLLQFGRVGKDEFTMDLQWPLSPFQAFAITLSSFDSKIACD